MVYNSLETLSFNMEAYQMLRIAICDDDKNELSMTRAAMEEYISENRQTAHIYTFTSAKSLLFSAEEPFDIYLLDVVMPEQDGIELGVKIRETDKSGIIIYLTTSPDFAIDGYDAQAFSYLLKPVAKKRLFMVLDQAFAGLKKQDKCIYIKTKEGTIRVPLDDIYYAELIGRAIRYVCRERVVDSVTSSLSFRDGKPPAKG